MVDVDLTGATPQPSLREAVEALLTAEQAGDSAASFDLIDGASRQQYPDVADWTARRADLPIITGFTVDDAATTDTSVLVVVDHDPGLDPFVGLIPAQERQTWTGTEVEDGWLVAAEPAIELILPPEDGIAATVEGWAAAVQACSREDAAAFEAVDPLFGESTGAQTLCESTGAVTVGAPRALLAGPDSSELVAQYSSAALTWARAVDVTAPDGEFVAILAPIGDEWKMIGLSD